MARRVLGPSLRSTGPAYAVSCSAVQTHGPLLAGPRASPARTAKAAVESRQRIVHPLIEAGLPQQKITYLLSHLAAEVMNWTRDSDSRIRALVADQPEAVRAAWLETIDRMIGTAPLSARPIPG